MTGNNSTGTGRGTGGAAGGWAAAAPELVIAVLLVAAVTAAAWLWAGSTLAAFVVAVATLGFLGLLRYLPANEETPAPAAVSGEHSGSGYSSIAGLWRMRSLVKNATESKDSYDRELRVTLQDLLAARLAERHGISLYDEPAAARSLLTGRRGSTTWEWLDPGRSTGPAGSAGIPPRTLAAILDQLEQL
jgi:hypothetical protein